MLSPSQNADFLNVHSKRKKENILSHDQANNLKKCKITLNHETNSSSSSSPSSSPSTSSPPSTATNCNKKPPNNLEKWLMMFHQWSHNERISALDALMTSGICEIQQIRYLLTIIEPQLQRDFISLLPKELSLYVLSFLDPPDLLRAAQTSRYWRILCEDNLLWREKCREEGLLEDNEGFNELFIKRISHSNKSPVGSNWPDIKTSSSSSSSSSSSPPPPPPQSSLSLAEDEESCDLKWSSNQSSSQTNTDDNTQCVDYKFAYLHNKNIEYNWRYGILNHNGNGETLPTFTDHHSNINLPILTAATTANNHQSCANNNRNNSDSSSTLEDKAKNGNVTGNSAMSSLPMQQNKPRKLKEILHLKGHEDHVITCLQFNPTSNIIVSGSDDNTLKVWSSITGRCLQILIGHTGGVWSSQLSADNIVISGSTDRTLRVWNALNGHCLHILYGHTSTVRCMALHDRHVVSGSRDATLRVWNIETGECVHVLVGHAAAVRCVQFNGKLCVSGAYDNWVKVWHVATETCLHTLEGHTNRVYSLQFDGKHIVSGSLDTSIRVWCAQTGKLKHTLIGHQSLTSGMQLRNNILVSGNADSTVRVWDINTGQCLQTLTGNNKHQSAVTCLQFNSKFVITSSDDGTVKLWDLKAGQFIRNLVTLPSGGSGGVVWRIRSSNTKLVCAVGSRNGTEETKLLVLDFETSTNNDMRSSFCNNSVFQEFTEFPTPTLFDDIDNQFQQPPQPTEPTNSPYSVNRLSSFCNNCKHAYLDFKLQQLQSAQNQHQPILSSSTLTIPTCTSSPSLNSSLTSTPSSSNLILTSISSISSSSLQSNLSSTATIATSSSSLTASTSESVVSKLPMVEKLSSSTSAFNLKPSPSLSSNPRLEKIHTDLDCVSADDDEENEENEESNGIMRRTMIDDPANDLYNSDNNAAYIQNKSDSNNFSRPKSVPNDDEESQDPC